MSRKFIDLIRRPKLYGLRQHPHTISFCYVLVFHSKTWVCLLNDQKGRIYYSEKEDATVKVYPSQNRSGSVTLTNISFTINNAFIFHWTTVLFAHIRDLISIFPLTFLQMILTVLWWTFRIWIMILIFNLWKNHSMNSNWQEWHWKFQFGNQTEINCI